MAKLFFVHAPMSTGKSATLLMKAFTFEKNGIPVMLIKPSIDNRDNSENCIKSRIGLEHECYTITQNECSVWGLVGRFIKENCTYPEWILVDEAQFLTKEQVNSLGWITDNVDINVICYGLRSDFQGNLFEGSKRLFEMADSIEELKLSCSCGRKAIINARVDKEGKLVTNGEQIEIGGDERYISICRKCYNEKREVLNKHLAQSQEEKN